MRPKNKFESQGESLQVSCKTSNDVRCRDVGSEESTREEVGCGGNEDVKMDEWVTKMACIETRRRICGLMSDSDGGAGEKTEAEVLG